MASEFTDLALTQENPATVDEGSTKSSARKRGLLNGRVRLLPLDAASAAYEPSASGNASGNNSGNNGMLGSASNYAASASALGLSKLKRITQKKELLEAVRKVNSPIVLPSREPRSAMLQRNESSTMNCAGTADDSDGSAARDIECLEDSVHANARKYNEHKMLADKRQRELDALMDELRGIQLETQTLDRVQQQDTPVAKQSQRIRLDTQECVAAMEEQMHTRRQLEHMVRRLQTAQLRVDAQLEGMGRAVQASQHEVQDVQLLCRQLEAGKSRAVQFLQDVQAQIEVERKARSRELCNHEIRARNAQKMESWRLQRIQQRAEMAAELRGDLTSEEEQRLLRCIESRERANEALHASNQVASQRATDYEQVVDQLKMAMGADSLQHVLDKIQAQATTITSLEKEKAQAEAKLLAMRQEKEHAMQMLNELKASGSGTSELNRDVYKTLESEIQQAKATLKVNRAAYERLDGVMQAVRQGSVGLAQRLAAFDDALELNRSDAAQSNVPQSLLTTTASPGRHSLGLTSGAMLAASGSDNANCLTWAEVRLARMLEILGQQSDSVSAFGTFTSTTGSPREGNSGNDSSAIDADDHNTISHAELLDDRNALWSPTANNDPAVHHNNIRVQALHYGQYAHHYVDHDNTYGNAAEDDDGGMDSARSDASSADDHEPRDVVVPSREILKMSSMRHFAEIMRKKEMLEKQKAAAERGVSDEELLAKMRKKHQLEADARLATSPIKSPAVLVTSAPLSDDNLTRSIAFVTQLNFAAI